MKNLLEEIQLLGEHLFEKDRDWPTVLFQNGNTLDKLRKRLGEAQTRIFDGELHQHQFFGPAANTVEELIEELSVIVGAGPGGPEPEQYTDEDGKRTLEVAVSLCTKYTADQMVPKARELVKDLGAAISAACENKASKIGAQSENRPNDERLRTALTRLRSSFEQLQRGPLEATSSVCAWLFNIPKAAECRVLDFPHAYVRSLTERIGYECGTSERQIVFEWGRGDLRDPFKRVATAAGSCLRNLEVGVLRSLPLEALDLEDPVARWVSMVFEAAIAAELPSFEAKRFVWSTGPGTWHIPPDPRVVIPQGTPYPEPDMVPAIEDNTPPEDDTMGWCPHSIEELRRYADRFARSPRYALKPRTGIDWESALENHWAVRIEDLVSASVEMVDVVLGAVSVTTSSSAAKPVIQALRRGMEEHEATLSAPQSNYFRELSTSSWLVGFRNLPATLKNKGARYIRFLMQAPTQSFHYWEIARDVDEQKFHGADLLSDPRARSEYEKKLEGLKSEYSDADELGQDERRSRILDEIAALKAQLKERFDRRLGSEKKAASDRIRLAIKSSLKEIRQSHRAFSRHLEKALKKSAHGLRYDPDEPIDWLFK